MDRRGLPRHALLDRGFAATTMDAVADEAVATFLARYAPSGSGD
ncbi:hypothetical protein [Tsukamurella ocularis]|nr:hypothetical protein [Tsukamurella ocularis]MCS3780845.1 hypothetical protein [Tsukamurella ocularis]MCS3786669.1 hypothetical protein [Tsukamurella ocularis]MCS3850511.1 hypothetical protein [Tsukamurella ocularis]